MLDFGRVFKAGIDNGPGEFGLEQEILEAGCVDCHVVALLGVLGASGTLRSSTGRRVLRSDLLTRSPRPETGEKE